MSHAAVRVLHSSDLHLGAGERDHRLDSLDAVLHAAHHLHADVAVLAGDVFDHNRVPDTLVEAAADILGRAGLPVVILPGNHDCLSEASVYRRGLEAPDNVHVIGLTVEESVCFEDLDLEVWGRPHFDYFDMSPLRDVPPRLRRWRVAAAHGHWVSGAGDLHRAYLIHEEELAVLDADYVALGHWDRAAEVGNGGTPAHYSGSPTFAGTVNLVHLDATGGVTVSREAVHPH